MNHPENELIYKVCTVSEWSAARIKGAFEGSEVDLADGFIHFSTADQLQETVSRHFAGLRDLVLVEVAVTRLEPPLKWEPSRGGALFPHLYGLLPLEAATREWPLPLTMDDGHQFPGELELTNG